MADPRVETEKYLEKHRVKEILESLTAQLLFVKPENPVEFMCKYLENAKASGTPALFDKKDVESMFDMFVPTNRVSGTVTAEQANSALKSILGEQADLGLAPGKMLNKDQFVACMTQALHKAGGNSS